MPGWVSDGERIVVAVSEQVVRHRGRAAFGTGVGVLVDETAGVRAIEAGAHVHLPTLRVGPLTLVADLDRGPGGGQCLTPRGVGGRPDQAGPRRGEQPGEVVVLVVQRERLACAGDVDSDDGTGRVTGVGGGRVGGDLDAHPLVGQLHVATTVVRADRPV